MDTDPPLTEQGRIEARDIAFPARPDLIITSPMTRTIQTAAGHFGNSTRYWDLPRIQVWPDLREASDAAADMGPPRFEMIRKYPQLDFSECREIWNYPDHTFESAVTRAERVRKRLLVLAETGKYHNVYVVTHRRFIGYLVQGKEFKHGGEKPSPELDDTRLTHWEECRSYGFARDRREGAKHSSYGLNSVEYRAQDFGPTILIRWKDLECGP